MNLITSTAKNSISWHQGVIPAYESGEVTAVDFVDPYARDIFESFDAEYGSCGVDIHGRADELESLIGYPWG